MKIVSWNINSIRARLPGFEKLARDYNPDIILLQETRVVDDLFPRQFVEDLGYNLAIKGEKGRNGVAICSKHPIEEVKSDFSEEARYIEAFTGGLFVASIYVINGHEVEHPEYFRKLSFLRDLSVYLEKFRDEIFVLGGDFNVGPRPEDIYIKGYNGIAGTQQERDALALLRKSGYTDVLKDKGFTWWSYRQRDFQKDNGFRLDHFYMREQTEKLLKDTSVLHDIREMERPSDHAPIMCELDL